MSFSEPTWRLFDKAEPGFFLSGQATYGGQGETMRLADEKAEGTSRVVRPFLKGVRNFSKI